MTRILNLFPFIVCGISCHVIDCCFLLALSLASLTTASIDSERTMATSRAQTSSQRKGCTAKHLEFQPKFINSTPSSYPFTPSLSNILRQHNKRPCVVRSFTSPLVMNASASASTTSPHCFPPQQALRIHGLNQDYNIQHAATKSTTPARSPASSTWCGHGRLSARRQQVRRHERFSHGLQISRLDDYRALLQSWCLPRWPCWKRILR